MVENDESGTSPELEFIGAIDALCPFTRLIPCRDEDGTYFDPNQINFE